ncbi:MAG: hypothetical protein ACI9XK_004124, partial [Granulosicoccus sp.]
RMRETVQYSKVCSWPNSDQQFLIADYLLTKSLVGFRPFAVTRF